jgi:hypothetical protein
MKSQMSITEMDLSYCSLILRKTVDQRLVDGVLRPVCIQLSKSRAPQATYSKWIVGVYCGSYENPIAYKSKKEAMAAYFIEIRKYL